MTERIHPGADSVGSRTVPGRLRKTRVRLGAVLAILIAAAVAAWLIYDSLGSSFSLSPVSPIAPEVLTAGGLATAAGQVDHPVYWAGTKPGYSYEFSRGADDSTFVRYLPPGAALGAKGRFLVIGTYRLRDAYLAIQRAARNKKSHAVRLAKGALAVYSETRPNAYYFASPDSHYQVGVFAPTANQARTLVLGGRVVSVR